VHPPARCLTNAASVSVCIHSPFGDPFVDDCGVEADELADLEVGDSAFEDESANESFGDAEMLGEVWDPQELAGGHGCEIPSSAMSGLWSMAAVLARDRESARRMPA